MVKQQVLNPDQTIALAEKMLFAKIMLLMAISILAIGALPGYALAERTFSEDTLLSEDLIADGIHVLPDVTLTLDPAQSVTITTTRNFIVEGTLVMKPQSNSIRHTIRFEGINESAFVGGGMEVLDSDVGLWVVGNGRLDLAGSPRAAWGYEWGSNWQSSDEVLAAPHTLGDYTTFSPVTGAADIPAPNDLGYRTEVFNLTRNVIIEGTPGGRAHVLIKSAAPQTIKYAALRNLGPDPDAFAADTITGRYPLHFHHNGDGARASLVEGVVVAHSGNRAFVPHASNGITFKDTIAYDIVGEAYWWDHSRRLTGDQSSDDIIYDHALAARVQTRNYTDGGFDIGKGEGALTCIDSVAVGVIGTKNTAGFHWPATQEGVWLFERNRAHNNKALGIFVWQNTGTDGHVINDFTAYYNGSAGINHGAYRNSFHYLDLKLFQNHLKSPEEGHIAIVSRAGGRPTRQDPDAFQLWADVQSDGNLLISGHARDIDGRNVWLRCQFDQGVKIQEGQPPGHYSHQDFVECDLIPEDFNVVFMSAETVVRVQDGDSAYQLHPDGSTTKIDPFFDGNVPPPGDNRPPAVALTAPASGAVFNAGDPIQLTASASDDGLITEVAFYQGDTLLYTDSESPYAYVWNGAPVGTHTLVAEATDNEGLTGTSPAVSISVGTEPPSDNEPPEIIMRRPRDGATFVVGRRVLLGARATDADGRIESVNFYANGSAVCSDDTRPYRCRWQPTETGTYAISAEAVDDAGAKAIAAGITLEVVETDRRRR